MGIQIKGLVTLRLQRTLLGRISTSVKKYEGFVPLPNYIEKMMAFDKIFCFKCGSEIELMDFYDKSKAMGRGKKWVKYYHKICYDKLFH